MKVYAFIDDQKTDFPIETLCKVTGVSRSAFYDWVARRDQGPSPAAQVEAVLVEQIRRIHRRSRSAYGAPRVVAQLAKQDVVVNHKRVERLMRVHQIQGRCGRRKIRTTVRDPLASPSPDLVDRHFEPDGLDVLWIGDVTYIPTGEGWLYLATVLDACSRRLLGWSLDDHMRAELCVDALDAAVGTRGGLRRLVTGVIFHSDHGTQYTSREYRRRCRRFRILQSMGTIGDSYDNAKAEAFFASFKRELVDHAHFETKAEARLEIIEWLTWYNHERLHTSLQMQPPVEYEQHLNTELQVA